MAASNNSTQTLRTITQIKLTELGRQKTNFEKEKIRILDTVNTTSDAIGRIRTLLQGINEISMKKSLSSAIAFLPTNLELLLDQAKSDRSVSSAMLQDWEATLRRALDTETIRYNYAALFGALVDEWITSSDNVPSVAQGDGSLPEKIDRESKRKQMAEWEELVFNPLNTDTFAINKYLERLFNSTKQGQEGLKAIKDATKTFEEELKAPDKIDEISLKWCIEGLLRSDLLTDERRAFLEEKVKKNKAVLKDVKDVLNMTLARLDTWSWPKDGIMAEQRRQLKGKYRIFHDEDLLDALLLRYLGVKWSVHFRKALKTFSERSTWTVKAPVPMAHKVRRQYFLGAQSFANNVEEKHAKLFRDKFFLSQLQEKDNEVGRSYSAENQEEDEDLTIRDSPADLKQSLLRLLSAEIIMHTRLHGELAVLQSDFRSFGPSLAHSTVFTMLRFFGTSERWISFFQRALEVPLKFALNGSHTEVRVRKRGTPMSSPLADMFAEISMYCMDFAVNQATGGSRLYRLHDDFWFWGSAGSCAIAWKTISEFANLMGLKTNEEKTGSQVVVASSVRTKGASRTPQNSTLPAGKVHWGFLTLDNKGHFVIDQTLVDQHVTELREQLSACKSILGWIQVYNSYAVRFFTSMIGKPAIAFGRRHIDMDLATFKRVQHSLFDNDKPHLNLPGGSPTGYLRGRIQRQCKVTDIPDGFFYFPTELGGLDLRNPFIPLSQVRGKVPEEPSNIMNYVDIEEKKVYAKAKVAFEEAQVRKQQGLGHNVYKLEEFMSFQENTEYREQTSGQLGKAFDALLQQPEKETLGIGRGLTAYVEESQWASFSSYDQWVMQMYGPAMIRQFGGLQIAEKEFLPLGMVSTLCSKRVKWQD